ncbi:hypothetical protein, partial [Dialister succinatiphilus]
LFDHMAAKAERKLDNPDEILKSLITESLSYLCTRDKAPLYTPVFWFFSKETLAYAQYLSELYKGLIPESHYENLHARPYQEVEREEDTFYTDYRLPAYILFFLAGLIFLVLAKA